MNDFELDVQTYLVAQGLVDGTTPWQSVRGKIIPNPDRIVVITADVGPTPEIHAASGLGSGALRRPNVQVLVRGEPNERDAARAKAADIFDALHALSGPTMNSNVYVMVRARASNFAQIEDDQSRPIFTMSYEATEAAA